MSVWQCPNCGSSEFDEVSSNRRQCVYCGSVLKPHELQPVRIKCPRCGFENPPGAYYCSQCSLALTKWMPVARKKTDPALISIIVTIVGSFFVPIGGAILGLFLAYKALKEARASEGRLGSESLARIAVAVGWIGLALSVLPFVLFFVMSGAQAGCALCNELSQNWF
jgi:ribosomal protein S27AE